MTKTFTIEGNNIHDIPTFYGELNRIFMVHEDWKLGASLDALNDLLYGGFGELKGNEPVTIIWKDFKQNRQALGIELTKVYYQEKLKSPEIFNTQFIQEKLTELERGEGQTYFEIILEIIADHPNITLIPE